MNAYLSRINGLSSLGEYVSNIIVKDVVPIVRMYLISQNVRLSTVEDSDLSYLLDNIIDKMDTEEQWVLTEHIYNKNISYGVYWNICCNRVIVQLSITDSNIIRLIEAIINNSSLIPKKMMMHTNSVPYTKLNDKSKMTNIDRLHIFSVKKDHPGALRKVNIFASDVIKDIKKYYPGFYVLLLKYSEWLCNIGMYNDQFCAAVIWTLAYWLHFHTFTSFGFLATLLPSEFKIITTIIKSTGCNITKVGSMCCELSNLAGRGVKPVDWNKDLDYRVDSNKINDSVVNPDKGVLKTIIYEILREELGDKKIDYMDKDDYWNERWLWCVNGAHNRFIEKENKYWSVNINKSIIERTYRKSYVEHLDNKHNPLNMWNGVTYFTTSEKLEHGKSRALYASDTISYICTNHLLTPIEKAWSNKKVILNPGFCGSSGLIDRISKQVRSGGYSVMLDYDDFNSQHSIASMEAVFECVINYTNYDETLGKRIIKSVSNSYIVHKGINKGKRYGTLMSGDRSTSFINTILNAAYLRYYIRHFKLYNSLHVGDDVYINVSDITSVDNIISSINVSPIRANSIKQSIGINSGEFLRICIGDRHCSGYLARSIASVVSGNWENEKKLNVEEAVQTFVQHMWTIRNRNFGVDLSKCFVSTLLRMTNIPVQVAIELLSHQASLNGGPVVGRTTGFNIYKINMAKNEQDIEKYFEKTIFPTLPMFATVAYLTHRLHEIENRVICELDLCPKSKMLHTSYTKSCSNTLTDNFSSDKSFNISVSRLSTDDYFNQLHEFEILRTQDIQFGILNKYPILVLYKNIFTPEYLVDLVFDECGIHFNEAIIKEVAFGIDTATICVKTPHIYSDLMERTKRYHCVSFLTNPCYAYYA